jgi:hypothetical protein
MIDTLKLSKRLQEAAMPKDQVEALAERGWPLRSKEDLVTKAGADPQGIDTPEECEVSRRRSKTGAAASEPLQPPRRPDYYSKGLLRFYFCRRR